MSKDIFLTNYTRPWKLITLFIGLSLLIVGSFTVQAPDWDINISLIMGVLTYFSAPNALRIILYKRYFLVPLSLFMYWFSVDGVYSLYWYFTNKEALYHMREANFYASSCLFWLCAFIWFYDGSLNELKDEIIETYKQH